MLLQRLRERELTAGWQGELKRYTLHHTPNHTNSNTLEHLRTLPKHFFIYFISLEFDDSVMHTHGFMETNKTRMQTRVDTRYTGAKTAVTKLTISQGIFLKEKRGSSQNSRL